LTLLPSIINIIMKSVTTALLGLVIGSGLPGSVDAHGALMNPPSRNAVDRFLPQFQDGKSLSDSCNCGDSQNGCDQGIRASGGGQPCLWFSQVGVVRDEGMSRPTRGRVGAHRVDVELPYSARLV
jgi:hypothetical protein